MPVPWASLIVYAGLAATFGCSGSDRPEMVPVSGTVLYHGKPLEGATVRFMGEEGRPSTGVTDAEGRFRLTAFDQGDGAVLGKHVVTVSKYAKPAFQPPKNPDGSYRFESEAQKVAFYNRPSVLPNRYQDPKRSGLEATVTADGPNDFTFELVD